MFKKISKLNPTAVVAVIMLATACFFGMLENKVVYSNAAHNSGNASAAIRHLSTGGGSGCYAWANLAMSITPDTVKLQSLNDNENASYDKQIIKNRVFSLNSDSTVLKYTDDNDKKNAILNKDALMRLYDASNRKIKRGGGWIVVKRYNKTGDDKKPTFKLVNSYREKLLKNFFAETNHYLNMGSVTFVPKSTFSKANATTTYNMNEWGNGDTGKSDKRAGDRIIYTASDYGLSEKIDSNTQGSVKDQRDQNRKYMVKNILGKNGSGLFASTIESQFEKYEKKYKDGDLKKLHKATITPDKNCDVKSYKINDYTSFIADIASNDSKINSLQAIREKAVEKSVKNKSLTMFAFAANIYEKNKKIYTNPYILEDYVSAATYNTVKNNKAIQDDLKKIMKYNDTIRNQAGKKSFAGSSPKVNTETEVYDTFCQPKYEYDMADFLTDYVKIPKNSNGGKSIVAEYINQVYAMAYIDMLSCGYSMIREVAPGKNDNAISWQKWEDAITNQCENATSNDEQYSFVAVQITNAGVNTKTRSIMVASVSEMINKVFGLKQMEEKNDSSVEKVSFNKGLIGFYTNSNGAKLDGSKKIYLGNSNSIKRYYDGKAGSASYQGNIYKRIALAVNNVKKKGSTWKLDKHVKENTYYSHNAVNMFLRYNEIRKNINKVSGYWDGSEAAWIELLNEGLTTGYKYNPVTYGEYVTIPFEMFSEESEPAPSYSSFELRVYSEKAHSAANGEALTEDEYGTRSGEIKNNDGRDIHDTAEYVKSVTYTTPGEKLLTDNVKLKIDGLKEFKEALNNSDKKYYVSIEYETSKEDNDKTATKLNDLSKKQNDRAGEYAAPETKAASLNKSSSGNNEMYGNTASSGSSEKGTKVKKSVKIRHVSTQDELKWPGNNRGFDKTSATEAQWGKYYKKNNDWSNSKENANLEWQTTWNDMSDTGIKVNIPNEKYEADKRICVKAKISVFTEDGKPAFEDNGWKNVVYETNPVYVTYNVKYEPKETVFVEHHGNIDNSLDVKAHAYSEFKEGSVYDETFEAMAGVPTTRTMYFATGGREFMINLQAVYDDYVSMKTAPGTSVKAGGTPDGYKTVRKYTVHFNGVDCEYKQTDMFKAGQGAKGKLSETFVADNNDTKQKKTVSDAQVNNSINIPGGGTGNITTKDHGTNTPIYAVWEGQIGNNSKTNRSGSNVSPSGFPCEGGSAGEFFTCSPTTSWDTGQYNSAVASARSWATAMTATSANGTILRKDDSDGYQRIYHCGEAKVVITLTGGQPTLDLYNKPQTYGTKTYDKSLTGAERYATSSDLGSGCSWHKGKKATESGSHYESKETGVHHSSWTGYEASADQDNAGPISYKIVVTFPNGWIDAKNFDGGSSEVSTTRVSAAGGENSGGIPAHAMCGPCCQHVLPAIEDTWTQKLRYDTVRFSAVKVWKLDDGYAVDMSAIKKKTSGDGTAAEGEEGNGIDPDSAPGSAEWDGAASITGNEADYVRSKIVRYDPNIFYNIAQSETSKAGRLRYSLQRGQDDHVYYEEMGDPERSKGQTRDNLCDGQTASHPDSPVRLGATGHKKSFCKGCLYSNDTYSNDMYHHDNPKPSTKKYEGWNAIDANKSTAGTPVQTKTGYSNNTADAIDKATTEWKRFDARRAQKNEVTVISDFLILQTSSGDQPIFYYDNEEKTLKTSRADENFSDDFWYSKPEKSEEATSSSYVQNFNKADSAWDRMWTNNPYRFKPEEGMTVFHGGYNGQYSQTKTKYKGSGNNAKITTAFDDDRKYFYGGSKDELSGQLKSRDGRSCPDAKITNGEGQGSRNIETKGEEQSDANQMNSDNPSTVGNVSSPGCGNMFNGTDYDTGTQGSERMNRNTYDFYKAPTMQSAWGNISWSNRIPSPGIANFGNANLVLLQDGISMNPTNSNKEYITGQSYAFYKPILEYHNAAADNSCEESRWDTGIVNNTKYQHVEDHTGVENYQFTVEDEEDSYLKKSGVTYKSIYTDGDFKVNDIICQDPVSVSYSYVIGADKKYDQRVYGDDKENAVTAAEEAEYEGCPGTAEKCIFRVKNCKYNNRMRKAAFDIDRAARYDYDEEDEQSGTYDVIMSNVTSGDGNFSSVELTGSGFRLVRDDGQAYDGTEKAYSEDGDAVTSYWAKHLEGGNGASLRFSWSGLGVDTERNAERYEVGADFIFNGTGEQALFSSNAVTVFRRSDGKIELDVTDGRKYVSSAAVGSGKHEILYRFGFDSVLLQDATMNINGKSYTLTANTGVKVDGKDLTFDLSSSKEPKGIPYTNNMGSGFTIGNASNGSRNASYSLDNIRVDRLPGSTSHTASCFSGEEVHANTSQNYYNGTGKLSTGKIDWTGKYDDGSMSQAGKNNKHTHTEKCLSSVSEGLKIAIQEASAGNTTDLRKELGEKVWNKVKDKLSECYGDDGSTVAVGQTTTYGYTGGTQKVTLVPGTYQLEAYGAKGGNDSQAGGNGGYAKGKLKVDKATDIYIAAGGKGADAATGNGGGYNGGGNAGRSGSSGGGGGATSISLANGTLKNVMASDRTNVLLVAGGGGGGGNARTDSTTRSDSEYVVYGRERATNAVHTFTAQASGTVYFWSQNCNNDPWGTIKIYRNGQLVTTKEDDDGGRGTDPDGVPFGPNSRGSYYNFNMSTSFQQGDYVELWVGSYSANYDNNYCTWNYKYNGTRTIDGKGGTGGGVSGGDGEGMNENAYGGSSNHASYKGYGGDCRAADGGGGGGGFYGGYGAQEDAGAGGGSGYTSPRLTETTMSNGVNSGNGYAKIKVLELKTYSPKKVLNVIKNVIGGDVSQIPSYVTTDGHTIVNPIWVCEGKYDEHVCTSKCKTNANGNINYTLECNEPHHTGEHYDVGDEMCYDACHDDAKHRAASQIKSDTNKEGKPVSPGSRFIRLDNYFQVYYPNKGDFYDSSDLGIRYTRQLKGLGYTSPMDTTEWTREKWIKFPYSVLYKRESNAAKGKPVWEEHDADEWFQVDVGYTAADGSYKPYDTYDFYCQLKNEEIKQGVVEFMVEAINDKGTETSPCGYDTPYGRNELFQQDCPSSNNWMTNSARFSDLTAYHSVYKSDLIDVVGRIGNLLFEDTTDWRFSNFFKKPKTPLEWFKDHIAYKVDQTKQNMYYSWHLNTGDTSEDVRGEKVSPYNEWYNTYTTLKWTDIGDDFYKAAPTPLEAYENHKALLKDYGFADDSLETEQLQFGHNLLWDITTIGNYYKGNLQIEPKYYALDTWTGKTIPVDVYSNTDEQMVPINYYGLMDLYGKDDDKYNELSSKLDDKFGMYLDWKHERKRRNATGAEWKQTQEVADILSSGISGNSASGSVTAVDPVSGQEYDIDKPMDIPHGEYYHIGNIQFQYLNERERTYPGNSRVTALHQDINGDNNQELYTLYSPLGTDDGNDGDDPSDYYYHAQRWHTTLGLPESVRFTDASGGKHIEPDSIIKDEDGNKMYAWEQFSEEKYPKRYVYLETALITAIGDVWDLRYDQKADNGVVTIKSEDGTYRSYEYAQTDEFPTLLAVYNGGGKDTDYDILQTH